MYTLPFMTEIFLHVPFLVSWFTESERLVVQWFFYMGYLIFGFTIEIILSFMHSSLNFLKNN